MPGRKNTGNHAEEGECWVTGTAGAERRRSRVVGGTGEEVA